MKRSTCTSPERWPKNIQQISAPIFFAPFQTRNYHQERAQKSFHVRPTKISTDFHPLFLSITLRKRYLLKLPIFHKVTSTIFGVVESESINSSSEFWKKYFGPIELQGRVICSKCWYLVRWRSDCFEPRNFLQNLGKLLIDSDFTTPNIFHRSLHDNILKVLSFRKTNGSNDPENLKTSWNIGTFTEQPLLKAFRD